MKLVWCDATLPCRFALLIESTVFYRSYPVFLGKVGQFLSLNDRY